MPAEAIDAEVEKVVRRIAALGDADAARATEPVPYEVLGPAPPGERCVRCGKGSGVKRIKHGGEVDLLHEGCARDRLVAMANPPVELPDLGPLDEGDKRRKLATDTTERRETAYHEAGHAVVGLAGQLPIAYVCSVPQGRSQVGHVGMVHRCNSAIGPGYRLIGGRSKATVGPKSAELDAFGNPPRKIERTPEEHHAEILMSLAGPMAEARLRNRELAEPGLDWRSLASSSDMRTARHHRRALGDTAKSWKDYEREAAALVDKYWSMIEAVADRLMKVDFISGDEVDSISGRVARRQHFTKLRNRKAA